MIPRYLKKTLLATLQEKQVVEKFHVLKDPIQLEAEAVTLSKGKTKKRTPIKHVWLWRIQEGERSVAQPKESPEARMERTSTTEPNKWPQAPVMA